MTTGKRYEKYFEKYDVPEKLKKTAIAIMQRFTITGLCDGMYICNTIAYTCGIGNGHGTFTGDNITDIENIARTLQACYGCNIYKNDLEELENILRTGELDKETAIAGMKRYISRCRIKKRSCDEWRIHYLNDCISQTMANIEFLEETEKESVARMRCRYCQCCRKGYFKSMPEEYVCTGAKTPFIIDDLNFFCTEYPNAILTLEDARTEDGWIPLSSGLYPKELEEVQVTYIGIDKKLYCDEFAHISEGEWQWSTDNSDVEVEIIAWKENCQPYMPK